MKTYVITYEHISGPGERTSNGWGELMRDLELLDQDKPKFKEVASDPIEEAKVKEMLYYSGRYR